MLRAISGAHCISPAALSATHLHHTSTIVRSDTKVSTNTIVQSTVCCASDVIGFTFWRQSSCLHGTEVSIVE